MAYADLSPKIAAPEIERPPQKPRRKRQSVAQPQTAIWPSVKQRTKGIPGAKAASILRAVATKIGQAILNGLLDPPEKPKPKPIDPLLLAVDRSSSVRALIGRVDVSGDSDGAAWAKLVAGARGRELHVWYRHGREVLADLLGVLERVADGSGHKVRSLWTRIERARQFGGSVFVAIIPLQPDASPRPAPEVTKKSRPRRNISNARLAPA